jgi:hypothetical protein
MSEHLKVGDRVKLSDKGVKNLRKHLECNAETLKSWPAEVAYFQFLIENKVVWEIERINPLHDKRFKNLGKRLILARCDSCLRVATLWAESFRLATTAEILEDNVDE